MNFHFCNYEIEISVMKTYKQIGICSKIWSNIDRHILLVDFDNSNLDSIKCQLSYLQKTYCLPRIYIVESSKGNYHAYSFCSRSFSEMLHILSDIPDIDETFIRLGATRGYWTLRIQKRDMSDLKYIDSIISDFKFEVYPDNLFITEYYTMNNGKNKKHN